MSSSSTIQNYMQAMKQSFQAGKAGGLNVTYRLQVTGNGGGDWTIAVANRNVSINQGAPPRADVSITLNTDSYLKLAAGGLNIVSAYQRGQIGINGNQQLALKFAELFPPWASFVSTAPEPLVSPEPAPEPPKTITLADYVRAMPNGFRADRAGSLRATYQFELSGIEGSIWTTTVANGACSVSKVMIDSPNVVIRMSDAHFIELAKGRLSTVNGFQKGLFQLSGDLDLAAKFAEIFGAWANTVGVTPYPTPPPKREPKSEPTPEPKPTPQPEPKPSPTPAPAPGSVYPQLMNGSFDEYQPYVRKGETKVWKEDQFPERYGAYWTLETIDEKRGRFHLMDSAVFGKFTQKYFGGGGRDYHIHGRHSQVITSRYRFDMALYQTVAAQPGRNYSFKGSLVTYFQGTSGPPVHDKIFKTIGIDPTGGQDYKAPTVVWGERDGRDNEWRYPELTVKAQANAITVFIRIENTEKDVGETELNIIHLDNFELK